MRAHAPASRVAACRSEGDTMRRQTPHFNAYRGRAMIAVNASTECYSRWTGWADPVEYVMWSENRQGRARAGQV